MILIFKNLLRCFLQASTWSMLVNVPKYVSIQLRSVSQLGLTLCNPMDCNTPGFPVHHQLLELTQTHVYQVGDAFQPSQPLSATSPPAFNLSQHQGLCI